MKLKILVAVIVLAISIIVMPAYADVNLTQSTGENFIRWSWSDPSTPLIMVYVDGAFIKNSTSSYYYLTDLRAMEEHRIDLYTYNQTKATTTNGTISSPDQIGDLVGTKTSSTTLNSGLFYILLILMIALTIITAIMQNPVKGFLIGVFACILAVAISIIAGLFMDWLILLSIITGVLAAIFTILHAQSLMKNTYINFPW